jgi:hypothetical protein
LHGSSDNDAVLVLVQSDVTSLSTTT